MKLLFLVLIVVPFFTACSSSSKKVNKNPISDNAPRESNLPTTDTHQYIQSVKTKVRAKSAGVADCYTNAIKKSEDLVGKIYFAWDILENGEIEKLRVNREKSTIKNEDLETCMMDIFSKIKFEPLQDKDVVHINYPFKFTGKKTSN